MRKTYRHFDADHEDDDFLGAAKIMGLVAAASFIVILMSIMMILSIDKLNPRHSSEDNNTVSELEFGIVQIKNGISPEVIYDKNTKIMYIMSDSGFITPLLDSDGNIKRYDKGE